MKRSMASGPEALTGTTQPKAGAKRGGKIHPVIIYPYKPPEEYSDLEELYQLVATLDAAKDRFRRPITVMDRKTHASLEGNKRFLDFRNDVVAKYSDILDAWCVDTCQMWYSGLGAAFERGAPDDIYWLIPGDFNYGSSVGKEVLNRLHDLPEICLELGQDICIGEIMTDHNHAKRLIDTYGTFALLYNWFPAEAREIRQYTEWPRSEFFAVRHSFLRDVLQQRWFAYEQTVVMLLQAVFNHKRICRFSVGQISDLPEGRESLSSSMQQVERTERVLKTIWRERNAARRDWSEQYRMLETQSEQVRQSAVIILKHVLG